MLLREGQHGKGFSHAHSREGPPHYTTPLLVWRHSHLVRSPHISPHMCVGITPGVYVTKYERLGRARQMAPYGAIWRARPNLSYYPYFPATARVILLEKKRSGCYISFKRVGVICYNTLCVSIYHPHCVRGDILHIVPLLRNGPICGNNSPLAGRVIQIHTGVIAHINTPTHLWESPL
eukprot:sb/3471796/